MAHNIHDLGDIVRVDTADHTTEPKGVDGRFKNAVTGVVMDPDGVSLKVKNPAGTVTTYTYPTTITKAATGSYYKDIDASSAGDWYYRWIGTGNGQAADEKHFEVREAEAV